MAALSGSGWSSLKTKEVLLGLLQDFENISKELIDGLASVAAQRGPAKQLSQTVSQTVEKIIQKDKEIQHAICVGEKQILRQQQIIQAKEEIAKKDQEISQLQNQLREAEQILSNALFDAKRKLTASRQASHATISSEDLIKYAFRISSSSSVEAPPDWQPGDSRRPYPLDLEMRRGLLGQFLQQTGTVTDSEQSLTQSNTVNKSEDKQTRRGDITAMDLTALNDQKGNSQSSSIWSSSEATNMDVHQQIMENEEQPYTMISANAIQPREMFNGGQASTNTDDVEFMSSSSDSSSSDSP